MVEKAQRGKAGTEAAHPEKPLDEIAWFTALTTYLGYAVLICFGHLRDFFGKATGYSRYFGMNSQPPKGYAPLLQDWENFYTRRLYHRIQDCWNRPIAGPPTASHLKVVIRKSNDGNYSLAPTNEVRECLNLGSYNYLGFADDWSVSCKAEVTAVTSAFPVSTCTSFAEGGYTALHAQLERMVAAFVGKPAALVFNMVRTCTCRVFAADPRLPSAAACASQGYTTNALGIPAIMGKGALILSDSMNHTSIVNGARASGATIRVFKHNDASNLEAMLRQAVVEGQERSHRPWKKVLVMVEGIYSMEGDICALADIVRVAKRYRAYVYLDEAHSVGAMGRTGRGICEHAGVDPAQVDVLMGTFTKSFGAMGGYIAGSAELVAAVRATSAGFLADNAMPPGVCQQILTAFRVLKGEDGTDTGATKLRRLRENANYFRRRLAELGAEVIGDADSPIIPLMLYNPTKIAAFSRECLDRGLAVVVVGFPATPVLLSRTRFCISAGHTRQDLDLALDKIREVCDVLRLRYANNTFG